MNSSLSDAASRAAHELVERIRVPIYAALANDSHSIPNSTWDKVAAIIGAELSAEPSQAVGKSQVPYAYVNLETGMIWKRRGMCGESYVTVQHKPWASLWLDPPDAHPQPLGVPEGWVLAPKEPTAKMQDAAAIASLNPYNPIEIIYKAMLSAIEEKR